MRSMTIAAGIMVALMCTSCGGGQPTEKEIVNSLEATLQSVAGDWVGGSTGTNPVRLEFRLQEGANGQLSGTGTMKEDKAAASVPIIVTGTFQRPMLTLAFDGMVYESHQVKGVAQGAYTTVGGVGTNLVLNGTGYARELPILLQEK